MNTNLTLFILIVKDFTEATNVCADSDAVGKHRLTPCNAYYLTSSAIHVGSFPVPVQLKGVF